MGMKVSKKKPMQAGLTWAMNIIVFVFLLEDGLYDFVFGWQFASLVSIGVFISGKS